MGRNLLLKGNSKLPAKETIPHSVKLLPTNVVVSLKDVPSSMLPTLTLVVLHQNNSTHRTLTRISSSFSKDNSNNPNNNLPSNPNNNLLSNLSNSLPQDSNNLLLDNNNNIASLIPNLPKPNSLPKTHNSLPLDNSNSNLLLDNNNNLPPSNNSSLPLSHNSLLLHHSPS